MWTGLSESVVKAIPFLCCIDLELHIKLEYHVEQRN